MINTISRSFKRINWKLLSVIFATLFIPVIYRTLRFHFIGSMPDPWAYSMGANLQWINVIFEVLDEAFLLPFFFTISLLLLKGKGKSKIVGVIYMISIIYIIFSIVLILFTPQFMTWLSDGPATSQSIYYIRLEVFNRVLIIIPKIFIVILIAKNKWRSIITILIFTTAINMALDTFIISSLSFSMQAGIIGIGWNTMITGILTVLLAGYLVSREFGMSLMDWVHPEWFIDKINNKEYLLSGLESFIRNAFFIWFVIKSVYKGGTNDDPNIWWVVNSLIWDWLLIPIFALSRYINRDVALNKNVSFWERYASIFIMISGVILTWVIFIPAYPAMARDVFNNDNYKQIAHLVTISLGFYIMFAINEIADKSFYGTGRADLMLVQSIITNIIVYIPFYYMVNTMSLNMIAIMFGTSIAVDSSITFAMFTWVNSKKKVARIGK